MLHSHPAADDFIHAVLREALRILLELQELAHVLGEAPGAEEIVLYRHHVRSLGSTVLCEFEYLISTPHGSLEGFFVISGAF